MRLFSRALLLFSPITSVFKWIAMWNSVAWIYLGKLDLTIQIRWICDLTLYRADSEVHREKAHTWPLHISPGSGTQMDDDAKGHRLVCPRKGAASLRWQYWPRWTESLIEHLLLLSSVVDKTSGRVHPWHAEGPYSSSLNLHLKALRWKISLHEDCSLRRPWRPASILSRPQDL